MSASTAGLDGWGPVRAPSRVGFPGGETPLPLAASEIDTIVGDFARSARLLQQAGVQGVEVHGSHGWLVGQFLSPFYNRREDAYGGDLAGRCRLALEIGRAIRAAVGPGYPVGLTLTYDELIGAAGITPDDTLAQLEILSSAGVFDFFDLSIGSSTRASHDRSDGDFRGVLASVRRAGEGRRPRPGGGLRRRRASWTRGWRPVRSAMGTPTSWRCRARTSPIPISSRRRARGGSPT